MTTPKKGRKATSPKSAGATVTRNGKRVRRVTKGSVSTGLIRPAEPKPSPRYNASKEKGTEKKRDI